jgi:hypothetical protein
MYPPVVPADCDYGCANEAIRVAAGEAYSQMCDDFGVVDEAEGLGQTTLAEATVAIQGYGSGFCPCEALEQGTLFPELVY